jgi:hypothetical protein
VTKKAGPESPAFHRSNCGVYLRPRLPPERPPLLPDEPEVSVSLPELAVAEPVSEPPVPIAELELALFPVGPLSV